MFRVGDIVKIIYDDSIGAIVEIGENSYNVLVNGKIKDFF